MMIAITVVVKHHGNTTSSSEYRMRYACSVRFWPEGLMAEGARVPGQF